MCFSATASFIASGTLGAIGVTTVKKIQAKEELPLAMIPFLFAFQQAIEGVIWLGAFNIAPLYTVAVYLYMLFSHVLWPIWLPLTIFLVEKNPQRKKILTGFLMMGIIVACYMLFLIIKGPVTAQVLHHGIAYGLDYQYTHIIIVLYGLATWVSCLFSSHRMIKVFGITLILSLLMGLKFYRDTIFSIWCFSAAILSIIIYVHFSKEPVMNKILNFLKARG